MPSVDLQFARARHRDIRQSVARSSPVIVYQGSIGIMILAKTKPRTMSRPRIGKILDRLAIVSRGEIVASNFVHNIAAQEAHARAHFESKADVRGGDVAQVVSEAISQRYHAFVSAPLVVESCLVHLNDTMESDFLTHIHADGSAQYIEKLHSMSALDGTHSSSLAGEGTHTHEPDDTSGHLNTQEQVHRFNEALKAQWRDIPTVEGVMTHLRDIESLASFFAPGTSRDVVVLSREALLARTYDSIFQRLTIS